jgi:hypothetical protein
VIDYLNPTTGGRAGTGYQIGQRVYLSELFRVIQGVDGVAWFDDNTFTISDLSGMTKDEIVSPGTVSFTARLAP